MDKPGHTQYTHSSYQDKSGILMQINWKVWVSAAVCMIAVTACNPTVRVEAPDKPIMINMNIKIEHEIRVKVEKDLESVLSKDSGLY